MGTLLKVLAGVGVFAGFILFVSWMDRPRTSDVAETPTTVPASAAPGTDTPDDGVGYRLASDASTKVYELQPGGEIRFPLTYREYGAILTDSDHYFEGKTNDSVKAIQALGERPANSADGAIFLAPGGADGAAAATVAIVDRPPSSQGFDKSIDLELPAPSGRLLLAPNGERVVTDAIELPEGDYRARIRVRGPAQGEDVRIDLWPAE